MLLQEQRQADKKSSLSTDVENHKQLQEIIDANVNNHISQSIDMEDDNELDLISDPIIETRESDKNIHKQQVYVRQYQPPTPDPVDIQIQEVHIKSKRYRSPIHVHIRPRNNKNGQRTPSPIVIKTTPPKPTTAQHIFYNKYIPVNYKTPLRKIIIHRHTELSSKPRPVVIEQWLPPKPSSKRIKYRYANPKEFERKRNRFIDHKPPHITVEYELIRLPIIKITPEEYQNKSNELNQLDNIRSLLYNSDTLYWRI
ncbi:unnamed protein product [Adineta steineri]|uniref:Uncharacterized protein n=1 Tax=Adineta steineri TaxID=433720 RepID=A0A815G2P0_9BILA|nr:unnamed protein product [Adineta steineri]CAF3658788.1 unnamed protein product [Adineta steineri]